MIRTAQIARAVYLVLGTLLPACSDFMTDGATRIAYEIESAASAFKSSSARSYSIRHIPKPSPEGCAGPYKLQLSARSALVIWCKDSSGSTVVASHTTTYHLNFVDVPQTYIVDKAAGEPTTIDLEKQDGRIVVVAVK